MSLSSIGAAPPPSFTPVGAAQSSASATSTTQSVGTAAPVSAAAPAGTAPAPTLEQLHSAIQEVQKAVAPVAQSLQFSIDHDTGKTVVKVMDTETNKVLRQIPSEEVMDMAKALDKLQGLLVKQTA